MPVSKSLAAYVTNISSYCRSNRMHAVMHLEFSADELNRFVFTVYHFRPMCPLYGMHGKFM
jgi:hypothetical protein